MLHIKLHILLDILHGDISRRKAIFSLENVKIFAWQFQNIFQTFLELGYASEFILWQRRFWLLENSQLPLASM